ncbi:MAG: hypothetical protein IIB19_02705 [Chloroflexi bacterium]|nr:hypothetical protein [Chloroflexota bacterium]
MSFTDDMTIVLRLKHERTQRERATEERKQRRELKRNTRSRTRLRAAWAARHDLSARKRRRRKAKRFGAPIRTAKTVGTALGTFATRSAGWLGVALLVNDLAVIYHDVDRRVSGGMSARLVAAQDRYLVYGDIGARAQANADVLAQIEGDPGLLASIGQQDRMPSSLASNVVILKRLAYERAVGADSIRRDHHYDSADTFLDKLIMQGESADLKAMADRACHLIRTEHFGKVAKGR